MLFGCGSIEDWYSYKNILDIFSNATRMEISEHKLLFLESCVNSELKEQINGLFPFKFQDLECGFKYLG